MIGFDTSHNCDTRHHDQCDGTVTVMEQDGPNRYVCGCRCHPRHRSVQCDKCGGRGTVTVTDPPWPTESVSSPETQ